MADTQSTAEVESDVEICVVDDEDDDIHNINSGKGMESDEIDNNCDGHAIDGDNTCVQMEATVTATSVSDSVGKELDGDAVESKANNEENDDDKEPVSSNSNTERFMKGTAGEDQGSLLLEPYLPNHNARAPQESFIDIKEEDIIKEYHDSKSDSTSCDSDDEDDDYYENDGDVFKRFYFESDHLAFKHNRDYKNLLKTLIILEAERMSSVKDLEELQVWKEKALKDPISFVESLRSKNPPKLPERKQIPAVPTIDWMQYLASTELVDFAHKFKVKTRRSIRTKGEKDKQNDHTKTGTVLDNDNESTAFESTIDQGKLIHGKFDENKTVSFNRLWTNEEQEKLEKLLQIYPPEEVEARRWEKIARALGNRTPKQVSSRVQKYFIKLARAGLPIPGRVPHLTTQRKSKINPVSYRNSTFFPSWRPSIYMNDDDDDETSSVTTVQSDSTPYVSLEENTSLERQNRSLELLVERQDDEMIPKDLKESAEYRELMHLKRFKKEVMEAKAQCSSCGVSLIRGPQYRCSDCCEDQPYILCGQCMERNRQEPSSVHPMWHQIVLVGKSSSFVDGDYVSFELQHGKYNYLDPNFTPNVR